MKKIILSIALLSIWSCTEATKKTNSEWITLFDGSSLDGWRAYNGDHMPPGWKIVDSVLTFTTAQILEEDYDYTGSRDIIYGAEEFDNFELYVEWTYFPAMGVKGAAFATLVASVWMAAHYGFYLFSKEIKTRFNVFSFSFNKEMMRKQLQLAIPMGVQECIIAFGWTFFLKVVGMQRGTK